MDISYTHYYFSKKKNFVTLHGKSAKYRIVWVFIVMMISVSEYYVYQVWYNHVCTLGMCVFSEQVFRNALFIIFLIKYEHVNDH